MGKVFFFLISVQIRKYVFSSTFPATFLRRNNLDRNAGKCIHSCKVYYEEYPTMKAS